MMEYTTKQLSAVKGRITRCSKLKGVSQDVVTKLRGHVAMGRVKCEFRSLSDVDKAALVKTGFIIEKGDNEPPKNVEWVVSWVEFLKLKK